MRYFHACAQAARRRRGSRRGTIIVLSAILMVVLMGLLALSIDTGYMYTISRHFNVPGGRPVEEYREDLIQVFREIADNRPLKLVQ
jgi:hypothetical protein